jgi:hypothetical protein
VGYIENGRVKPLRAKPSGQPFRKPYLANWGRLKDWARIEKGRDKFTRVALDLSIKLWEELEGLWGQKICVHELEAIPWQFYSSKPAKMAALLEARWVDVLNDTRSRLPG